MTKPLSLFILLWGMLLPGLVFSQQTAALRQPVFPPGNPGLVFVEGEDAVSTNFANEPVLNYGTSGWRTLQLNRGQGQFGGAGFYAEYVFYAEEEGIYEFWYGGTPPGPKDELLPSLVSPVKVTLDGNPGKVYYREDVEVVENYTPSYYWVKLPSVALKPGSHRIRFEVTEKRKYDGRYFFYLDNFFLLKGAPEALDPAGVPGVFPKYWKDRSINQPFQSIGAYEAAIKREPENPAPYVNLGQIYSLIGDYQNALRYLNRALLLKSDDTAVRVLVAKNRIWMGDVKEGLNQYQQVLTQDPGRPGLWAEAAKVAAWSGEYATSLQLYSQALELFPKDLNLTVNMALTYLWSSQGDQASRWLDRAFELARGTPKGLEDLGQILLVNGYPDRAAEIWLKASNLYPEEIRFSFLLSNLWRTQGKGPQADRLLAQVETLFVPGEALTRALGAEKIKQTMKADLIRRYRDDLRGQPDNLELRNQLVQTLFWNGLRSEAVGEFLNILGNEAYKRVILLDEEEKSLLTWADSAAWLRGWTGETLRAMGSAEGELRQRFDVWERLVREKKDSLAAESALKDSLARWLTWEEGLLTAAGQAKLLASEWTTLSEDAKTRHSALDKARQERGWTWDRSGWMKELQTMEGNGNSLGSYLLGRITLFDGDPQEARTYLQNGRTTGLSPALYAQAQGELWETGRVSSPPPAEVGAYRSEWLRWEDQAAALLPSVQPPETLSRKEFEQILTRFERLKTQGQQTRETLLALQGRTKILLSQALERQFYLLEQDTYPLRYQLGEYYLTDRSLEAARRQYRMVLTQDPNNLSAQNRLGTVLNLEGDWRGAMDAYRKVYSVDPFFENVVRFHNQLATQNPDVLQYSAGFLGDTGRFTYDGSAQLTRNITTLIGLDLRFTLDGLRMYKTTEAGQLTEFPSHHTLLGGVLSLPLRFPQVGLVIKPSAGGWLRTSLFDDRLYLTEPLDYNGSTMPDALPDSAELRDFLEAWRVEPRLGGDVSWTAGPVNLWTSYQWGRIRDSFIPGRHRVLGHNAESSLNISLAPLGSFFQISGLRFYGQGQWLWDEYTQYGNFLATALGELNLGFHLFDSPWTNLSFTGTGVFQDSQKKEPLQFYTPQGVLTLKGGITYSTWIPVGKDVLGVVVRTAWGNYTAGLLGEGVSEDALLGEGEARLEWTWGQGVLTGGANLTQTFPRDGTAPYWALGGRLGFTAKLPEVLTP